MLTFGFDAVPLDYVVVVVSAFEGSLHFGELVLHAVELYTRIFSRLTDFADLFFFFSQLQVYSLVFVGQLLRERILESHHQNLKSKTVDDLRDRRAGKSHHHRRNIGQHLLAGSGRRHYCRQILGRCTDRGLGYLNSNEAHTLVVHLLCKLFKSI